MADRRSSGREAGRVGACHSRRASDPPGPNSTRRTSWDVRAGLIDAATLGLVGHRVAAVLTPAGHQALDAYALAA